MQFDFQWNHYSGTCALDWTVQSHSPSRGRRELSLGRVNGIWRKCCKKESCFLSTHMLYICRKSKLRICKRIGVFRCYTVSNYRIWLFHLGMGCRCIISYRGLHHKVVLAHQCLQSQVQSLSLSLSKICLPSWLTWTTQTLKLQYNHENSSLPS